MTVLLHSLFWLLFILQCASGFLMFEHWNSNVLIPFIVLAATGAWIFQRTHALLFSLLIILVTIGIYEFNAEHIVYYVDKATGPLVILLIIFCISHLRQRYDGIRELNRELDAIVSERDKELTDLTDELLENAERRRMALGQELHDGIGQQLTGIQLLCSSLENQLQSERKNSTQLAKDLIAKASCIHNDIRLIARALFPVRIAHVGLYSALNEMISCYSELHQKPMRVHEASEIKNMPESLALQLYRVCQECCTYLLEENHVESIEISLQANEQNYSISVTHDGYLDAEVKEESIFNLIRYRIKKINGSIRFSASPLAGQSVIYFEAPKPTH